MIEKLRCTAHQSENLTVFLMLHYICGYDGQFLMRAAQEKHEKSNAMIQSIYSVKNLYR